MKANKNSASEDRVGQLHNLITEAFCMKTQMGVDRLKAVMSDEDADVEDKLLAMAALDSKDLSAAAKWVQANEITCPNAAKDGKSQLSKNLDAIKEAQSGKVISFLDNTGT